MARIFAYRRWLAACVCMAICAGSAAAALFGCSERRPAADPLPLSVAALDALPLPVPAALVAPGEAGAEYAGSAACAGCHQEISAQHAATGHARSIRPISADRDAQLYRQKAAFTDDGLGLTHTPGMKSGKPGIQTSGFGLDLFTQVNFAVGSGSHGQTHIQVRQDGTGLVPRISLYRRNGRLAWDWTPGATASEGTDEPTGQSLPAHGVARCTGCHSTLVHRPFDPARAQLGVGCERCHGPGRPHLASFEGAGRPAPGSSAMPVLRNLTGSQTMALCNTCHRPLEGNGPDGLPADLARAQPLAIAMSRCFQKSGGRLSCTTCHDPHTPAVREKRHYEKACMGCHTPGRSLIRLCKVNQTRGCVNCHMSRQRMPQFNDMVFTHHWIRRSPPGSEQGGAP